MGAEANEDKFFAPNREVFPHTNYFIKPETVYWVRSVTRVKSDMSVVRGIAEFTDHDAAVTYVEMLRDRAEEDV